MAPSSRVHPPVHDLEPDELRGAHALFADALHHDAPDDDGWERARPTYSPGRTIGVSAGPDLIGTATSFPTRTAVPGGAALPTAAVTRVGVRADHTRRGVLSAMMTAMLDGCVERGEALASLRASEARIYGRFGYGVASRGRDVTVRTRGAGWRPGAPGGGAVRMVTGADVVPVLSGVHDRIALLRPGGIERNPGWWAQVAGGPGGKREHLVAAVHTGAHGDDGFAIARMGDGGSGFADRTMRIGDLHAADLDATAGLWRFLLGLDLIGRVHGWLRPVDEPLDLLLADPRDVSVDDVTDETWLRIVDVPAALAARSWGGGSRNAAEPVLLGVHDPLRPGNTGIYRIGDGPAERVGNVDPQIECDVAGFAAAYLGDRAPSLLAATGWWRAPDPAALPRADTLFATGSIPWCGTYF